MARRGTAGPATRGEARPGLTFFSNFFTPKLFFGFRCKKNFVKIFLKNFSFQIFILDFSFNFFTSFSFKNFPFLFKKISEKTSTRIFYYKTTKKLPEKKKTVGIRPYKTNLPGARKLGCLQTFKMANAVITRNMAIPERDLNRISLVLS